METGTAGSVAQKRGAAHHTWLYGPSFDSFFIFGVLLIAITSGTLVVAMPALAGFVILLNLWGLGYHHVIATFTRLCFDAQSHKRAFYLIYVLFPLTMLATYGLVMHYGLWILASVYLYAQWFHYTRQNWGISRAYERNAPEGYTPDRSWSTQAAFYSLPCLGILYRSWQEPQTFLSLPLKVIPVSFEALVAVGLFFLCCFAAWLWRIFREWRRGTLPIPYAYYMFSHFTLFAASYIAMPNLDSGWVVANIWHNLQYLLFVWVFNNRTYRNGIDPQARFLSFISQKQNVLLYFFITLMISTVLYMGVDKFFSLDPVVAMVPLAAIYMAINYHHYIVDAVIWRKAWIQGGKKAPSPPGG